MRTAWNKGLTKETDKRVAKLSEHQKGRTSWNKGLTKEMDERVKKNAEGNKGKHFERKGRKYDEIYGSERAEKIKRSIGKSNSISLKGNRPWNKGLTAETDDRVRINTSRSRGSLLKNLEFRENSSIRFKNMRKIPEICEKALIRSFETRSKPGFRSAGERLLLEYLDELNINYVAGYYVRVPNKRYGYFMDAAIIDHRVDFEYDGYTGHFTDEGLEIDAKRDSALSLLGWKIVRIKHRDIFNKGECLQLIRRVLNA